MAITKITNTIGSIEYSIPSYDKFTTSILQLEKYVKLVQEYQRCASWRNRSVGIVRLKINE